MSASLVGVNSHMTLLLPKPAGSVTSSANTDLPPPPSVPSSTVFQLPLTRASSRRTAPSTR